MTAVDLDAVTLSFGSSLAVAGVSLRIPSGSFVALLGPSGCGKTSLLRLIAGLERPSAGRISIGGHQVAGPGRFVDPQDRNLGMVFQSYALWPHMTVAGNVAFGLADLRREERETRTAEALEMVGLRGFASRKPHELSGGQRQRVALARSLAARPGLLLLDEPLANLDTHLRETMLGEFRRIHQQTGCTMIFVTHDQNEAMAVADLVGVMDKGQVAQFAPPSELFDRPVNQMVARFVGNGRTLPVDVTGRNRDRVGVRIGLHDLDFAGDADHGAGWLCLHARDLELVAPDQSGALAAVVVTSRFENGYHVVDVLPDDIPEAEPLSLRSPQPLSPGTPVHFRINGGWVIPRHASTRTPETLRAGVHDDAVLSQAMGI